MRYLRRNRTISAATQASLTTYFSSCPQQSVYGMPMFPAMDTAGAGLGRIYVGYDIAGRKRVCQRAGRIRSTLVQSVRDGAGRTAAPIKLVAGTRLQDRRGKYTRLIGFRRREGQNICAGGTRLNMDQGSGRFPCTVGDLHGTLR